MSSRGPGIFSGSEEARFFPSGLGADRFGNSVVGTAFYVVVGAPSNAGGHAGSAYVFVRLIGYVIAAMDEVTRLYLQGTLDAAQANALTTKLEAVRESLDRDDAQAAINHLRAFINQVNAYIDARILSPAQGQTLIDRANVLITLLGG